jgi:hypothetical protein
MSILRVEQDGVEFFTDSETGACSMSESGLARLCGIARASLQQKIREVSAGKSTSEALKGFAGRDFNLQANQKIDGSQVNFRLYPSDFCAAIIEHYTFETRTKHETARYSYRKFAKMGIDAWIQGITGWKNDDPVFGESDRGFDHIQERGELFELTVGFCAIEYRHNPLTQATEIALKP